MHIFDGRQSPAVIPVERPTVAYAENDSYKRFDSGISGSNILSINVQQNTTLRATTNIVKAEFTVEEGILFLNAVTERPEG